MTRFDFWQRWLFALSILITVFGIGLTLLSGTPVFDLFNDQINPAFWETKDLNAQTQDFQQWIYGVLGATMAGWGVFFVFIVRTPFRKRERWAWNCLAAGLGLWYVLDTALSLIFKVTFNVVFNTLLLVLVLLPLLATRRAFAVQR
jgi:hypothetical protein